jgi:hypothetical protein
VNDFDAESKYGFRPRTLAENQSVSNDGEMLARLTKFPRKNLVKRDCTISGATSFLAFLVVIPSAASTCFSLKSG